MFLKSFRKHGTAIFSFLPKKASLLSISSNLSNLLHTKLYFHRNKKAQEAIERLIDNSRLEVSFFVMCGLSGCLATLGILLNDVPILISAMVLAPLLNPVLAFAAGLSLREKKLIYYALKSLLGSILFVIILSFLLVKYLLYQGFSFDLSIFIEKFSNFNYLLFLAAFTSGFSGVYSWLRAKNASSLIGVAIAVSLIPFVSFLGILLGMGQLSSLYSLFPVFAANLLTIIAGATFAFLILGFSQKKSEISVNLTASSES